MRIAIIIRLVTSAILIYLVYTETGIFTAIALSLILISVEILAEYTRTANKVMKALADKIT